MAKPPKSPGVARLPSAYGRRRGVWQRVAAVIPQLALAIVVLARFDCLAYTSSYRSGQSSPMAARDAAALRRRNTMRRLTSPESSTVRAEWGSLQPVSEGDRSGTVVAKLLEVAVRSQMRQHGMVLAKVNSRLERLMQGYVESVYLSGRDLQTRLGLTARNLIITAPDSSFIDYGRLALGKLTLTTPAHGMSEALFDASDWGNFLVYPSVVRAATSELRGGAVQFLRHGVSLDSAAGRLSFSAAYEGRQLRCHLRLLDDALPVVDVDGTQDPTLAQELTLFFQNLCIDLAGVRLQYHAMKFENLDGKDLVRVRLATTVYRIPNPLRDRM